MESFWIRLRYFYRAVIREAFVMKTSVDFWAGPRADICLWIEFRPFQWSFSLTNEWSRHANSVFRIEYSGYTLLYFGPLSIDFAYTRETPR